VAIVSSNSATSHAKWTKRCGFRPFELVGSYLVFMGYATVAAVELADGIEKFANPVYSMAIVILLRPKDFLKLGRSNPFFATISFFHAGQICS
jgi:hypothetical protein